MQAEQPGQGSAGFEISAAISREITVLTKSLTGRGPTKVKTYFERECILVLMREAHTTSEGSLAGGGRQRDVAQTRVDISEDSRAAFVEIIERNTGQKVVGFITGSQQDPSLLAQVYILDASPLLSAVPEPEVPDAGA